MKIGILCLGDSLTYGYGVPAKEAWHQILTQETEWRTINRGANGDTLLGMQLRVENHVRGTDARVCLVMAGSNDLLMGREAEEVLEEILKLCFRLETLVPMVIFMVPPPSYPEMAADFWDPFVDYPAFNRDLHFLAEEMEKKYPRVINLLPCFSQGQDLPNPQSLYLDGIHLNQQGNRRLAEVVRKELGHFLQFIGDPIANPLNER